MPQTAGRRMHEIPGVEVNPAEVSSAQHRLLHLHGIANCAAMHRRRHLVCAENSDGNFRGRDRRVRKTLSSRCLRPLQPLNGRVVKESQ